MTFDHPWALLLLLPLLAWAAWEWRTSSRRGALLLKAGALGVAGRRSGHAAPDGL